jgi:periplasmic copper chaperone A
MFTRRTLLPAAFALAAFPAAAHDYAVGTLHIHHPWTRATPPSAKVAGGYMTIENRGSTPDRLIGGSFSRSKAFEVHEMTHEGGIMRMRELANGLTIPPGRTVELKPGGLHVMFMDLGGQLKEGESIEGALVFEKAGTVKVEFKVEGMGARGTTAGHDHSHHNHGARRP